MSNNKPKIKFDSHDEAMTITDKIEEFGLQLDCLDPIIYGTIESDIDGMKSRWIKRRQKCLWFVVLHKVTTFGIA